MLKESGKVIAVDGEYAWVRVTRRSACDGCQASATCGQKTLSAMLGSKAADVRLKAALDCAVGDEVVIGIPENSLVRLSVITYFMPLLFMILLACLGAFIASSFTLSADLVALVEAETLKELISVLFGLGGLVAGFALVRKYSSTLEKEDSCQPKLLSLKRVGVI
ncbi:MAG: hypothetical protein CSB48_12835 [Proteobacteria bacterium]|nr:MAG: hypothetical protein CSB48_12835 [Pseudomonadota bacterium]